MPTEHSLYRRKYLAVHGPFLTKMKYCQTCDIFRPPRTVHCGICECCIERLDHHCPWLGTCVGKRNYKYFICFVTLISILLINGVVFTIIHILDEKCYNPNPETGAFGKYSTPQFISMIILGLCIILSFFIFWLCGFHQMLILRNETTNENLKKSYALYGNPFYRGTWDNLTRLFRRDKRNWKPEVEIVEVEKLDYVEPSRVKRTFKFLRKMKKFDRKIPPKRS